MQFNPEREALPVVAYQDGKLLRELSMEYAICEACGHPIRQYEQYIRAYVNPAVSKSGHHVVIYYHYIGQCPGGKDEGRKRN